jgi:hypothetical protein
MTPLRPAAAQSAAARLPAFRVRDLPDELPIFRHMGGSLDYAAACARVRPSRPVPKLLAFTLPKDLFEGLREAAEEAVARFGVHGWLSSEGRKDDDAYLSLSLTHNPDLQDPGIEDVHQSTLGTSVNPVNEFYYGAVQRFRKLKNTYFDTYGFRLRTPAAEVGALGEFLSQCGLSLVRSRLSVLRGKEEACGDFRFGWHRDEPVYENLRINIPLRSDRSYRLQLESKLDKPDSSSPTMSDHYLAPGKAYTFDTNRPHRVYPKAACELDRIHLVLGFSPWFRYDREADAWQPNEFYGRVHPFDIVRSGALHPALARR